MLSAKKKPASKTFITKSKAGHYTVTLRKLMDYGTYSEVYKQNYIDSLAFARVIATQAKSNLGLVD